MSNMSYIYAALVLYESGKEITADGIISILKAAGVADVDEGLAKVVASSLAKIDIEEAKSKAVFAPTAVAAAAPAPAEEKKEEEKKEEAKEEKKEEEEEVIGLGALFG